MKDRQVIRARSQFDRRLQSLANTTFWDDTPANVRYVISVRDDTEQPTIVRLKAADMLMSRTIPTLQAVRTTHTFQGGQQGQEFFDWAALNQEALLVLGGGDGDAGDSRIH